MVNKLQNVSSIPGNEIIAKENFYHLPASIINANQMPTFHLYNSMKLLIDVSKTSFFVFKILIKQGLL